MSNKITITVMDNITSGYQHVLEGKTLYITQGETTIKLKGKKQLTDLIHSLGCKVISK